MEYITEIILPIVSIGGAIASMVSAAIAIKNKNSAQQILKEIKTESDRNVADTGSLSINNSGSNSGIISGINSGEINYDAK